MKKNGRDSMRAALLFFVFVGDMASLKNYFDTGIDLVEGEVQQIDFDKVLHDIPGSDA